jgi:hypothetical protein
MVSISIKRKKSNTNAGLSFVTQEVEKSNFYRDLEGVLDWEETKKN